MKKLFKTLPRKFWAIFIIVISVLFEMTISIIYHVCVQSDTIFPETLYYISQIVTSIFVISGTVIAVWQYYLSTKALMQERTTFQVQKAIDLSAYFKDNIIKLSQPVFYVYKNAGILEIMDSIDKNKIKNFDMSEAKKLLTQEKISTLPSLVTSDKFVKAVLEANVAYSLNLPLDSAIVKQTEHNTSYDRFKIAEAFLSRIVLDLMNNMEYFAMHFTHNTADSSVVFASLHQTYINTAQNLYYSIAKFNVPGKAKYYTNVIKLYNDWKAESDMHQEKIDSAARNTINYGTILEK